MEKIELKPCPFCGGIAQIKDAAYKKIFWAECKKCGVNTSAYENVKEAENAWNKRVEDGG